jgi:hypothetical protein
MSGQDEFEFRPRLGRIGSKGGAKPSSLKAYLKSARKRSRKMSGGSARAFAFAGARRVMIKARVHRLSGGGGGAQRAHVSYLERDGAGKDRDPAQFYNDAEEALDGQAWLKEHTNERHQFRFIVLDLSRFDSGLDRRLSIIKEIGLWVIDAAKTSSVRPSGLR